MRDRPDRVVLYVRGPWAATVNVIEVIEKPNNIEYGGCQLGGSYGAKYRTEHGWPAGSFYASGTFGQYVIVIPSERLVIARFGTSGNRYDIEGVSRLVADVIAATDGKARLAVGN